jgi:hypothetical protein
VDRHAAVKVQVNPALADHPDRLKWNAKYGQAAATFRPGPWLGEILSFDPPDGPVLELAGGPSGTALTLAAMARDVTVIDVSDSALSHLGEEAVRRGLGQRLTLVHADLTRWKADGPTYALVMCRYFWSAAVFVEAVAAVATGGLLGWDAPALTDPPSSHVRAEWCLAPGEPASLLPAGFKVLQQVDTSRDGEVSRRMVARCLRA